MIKILSKEFIDDNLRISLDSKDLVFAEICLSHEKLRALLEDAIFIIKDIGIAPDPINAKHDRDFLIKARDAGFE